MKLILTSALALALLEPVTAKLLTIPVERAKRFSASPRRAKRLATSNGTFNIPTKDWNEQGADYQWFSTVQVGTPPQEFTLVWDTGSPGVIIPGKNCTTCGSDNLYDWTKSSTFVPLNGGEGSNGFATGVKADPLAEIVTLTGTFQQDSVTIQGQTATDITFFMADSYPSAITEMPMDGIIGMSPGSEWLWTLTAFNSAIKPIFSFYLNRGDDTTGQLTIGGSDPSQYSGDMKTVDLDDKTLHGTWTIEVQGFTIDGKQNPSSKPLKALLDTGTAYMQAPDAQTVSDIYAAISSDIKPVGSLGVWGGPCDVMEKLAPTLTFTLGKEGNTVDMEIPKDSFNLGPLPGIPDICQGVFLDPGISGYNGSWIVGSPLIKGYYTEWDAEGLKWGVADLK